MDFAIGAMRVFAKVIGMGSPIVCLHGGFGLDHSYFSPYLDPIAMDHQLILADLRGHGRSDPLPRAAFRIEAIIADLEVMRAALGHERWAVCGHSGGGLIAAQYAATHPDRVSHLIVIGGFPKFPFRAPEWLQLAHRLGDPEILEGLEMFLDGLTSDGDYRAACLKIAPLFFADPLKADMTPFERIIYRIDPYLEAMSYYAGLEMGATVAAYHQPVLIMHGDKDHRVPVSEGRKWCKFLPQAEWVVLPNAGHFPFIEQSATVCAAMDRFLRRA